MPRHFGIPDRIIDPRHEEPPHGDGPWPYWNADITPRNPRTAAWLFWGRLALMMIAIFGAVCFFMSLFVWARP